MDTCIPCQAKAKRQDVLLQKSKDRAIEEATKKGKELGEKIMAIGIEEKDTVKRWTYAKPGAEQHLGSVEYIFVM